MADITWHTPRIDQGQMVTHEYGMLDGSVYQRVTDERGRQRVYCAGEAHPEDDGCYAGDDGPEDEYGYDFSPVSRGEAERLGLIPVEAA